MRSGAERLCRRRVMASRRPSCWGTSSGRERVHQVLRMALDDAPSRPGRGRGCVAAHPTERSAARPPSRKRAASSDRSGSEGSPPAVPLRSARRPSQGNRAAARPRWPLSHVTDAELERVHELVDRHPAQEALAVDLELGRLRPRGCAPRTAAAGARTGAQQRQLVLAQHALGHVAHHEPHLGGERHPGARAQRARERARAVQAGSRAAPPPARSGTTSESRFASAQSARPSTSARRERAVRREPRVGAHRRLELALRARPCRRPGRARRPSAPRSGLSAGRGPSRPSGSKASHRPPQSP